MNEILDHIGIAIALVVPSVIAAYSSLKNGRVLKNGVTSRMHKGSSALCPKCYHVFKIDS